ncbi:MAG: hypothetical protein OES84_00330 [Kiritimatiellaceae bacterium]|nr:hypothetical protein [Kiritimatiellaceae bacterium]
MSLCSSILFWLGIIALIDGSLGLLFQDKWQKLVGTWNIQRIALVEIAVAFVLLAVHFLLENEA